MRKYFTAGLIIFLPVLFTFWAVKFLLNFFTDPFTEIAKKILLTIFSSTNLLLKTPLFLTIFTKFLILFSLVFIIIGIGFLARLVFVNVFFSLTDQILHKVPLINKIYKACKDLVHSFFSSSIKPFSQVVLVPFPAANTFVIGLITQEEVSIESKTDGINSTKLIPVLVPGTPNPSVGYLLMYPKNQVTFIDMRVEEAIKFVISCGIVLPSSDLAKSSEIQ